MTSRSTGGKRLAATCPACGEQIRVRADREGKRVRCPACEQPFVIGGESPPAMPSRRRPASKRDGRHATSRSKESQASKKPLVIVAGVSVLFVAAIVAVWFRGSPEPEREEVVSRGEISKAEPPITKEAVVEQKAVPKEEPPAAPISDVNQPRSITPEFIGPDSLEAVDVSSLPTFQVASNKPELAKWCDYQLSVLRKSPKRPGHLVVGKVELSDSTDSSLVNSQDRIQKDGTFGHITRDLSRPFGFRAHGYEPVDVQLTGCKGRAVDVGTIRLKKLSQSSLRPLKGRIALEGQSDAGSTTVELRIRSGPLNLFAGSRPFGGADVIVKVAADGTVNAEGFSPTEYSGRIKAPGFVPQRVRPDFATDGGADLGEVTLEKKRTIGLEYIVADASSDAPFDTSTAGEGTWSGGGQWQFPDGNTPFVLEQKDGEFKFRSQFYGTRIRDLGKGQLTEFLDVNKVADDMTNSVPALSGHVYLIHAEWMKSYVLLRVTDSE